MKLMCSPARSAGWCDPGGSHRKLVMIDSGEVDADLRSGACTDGFDTLFTALLRLPLRTARSPL